MKSGLPDAPILKSTPSMLDAGQYNQVRLALARLGSPQQIVLGMRGLSVTLERDLWICSDRRLNDIPLIAWADFDNESRAGIHAPVRCQVYYYHAYARVVGGTVLTEVDRRVRSMLAEAQASFSPISQVVPFRPSM